jgi:hypothetical protein
MKLAMTLDNIIDIARNDLDNNYYDVIDAWSELIATDDYDDNKLVEFIIDQWVECLNRKGITLVIL